MKWKDCPSELDAIKAAIKGTVIALSAEKKKGFGQWTQLLP